MRILFTLPAPTIYDAQQRAMSWKHTPTSRDSLKGLKELLPRLRELGVSKVISSDLDLDTAKYLAKKLAIPYEEWSSLRRFNVGKLHGLSIVNLKVLLDEMELKWHDKPDIPLKGGDSRTSYEKRMAVSQRRLNGVDGTPLIIAGSREIGAILSQNVGQLERYHIYEVERGKSAQAA